MPGRSRVRLLQRQDIADIWRIYERVDQRQLSPTRVPKDVARALAPEHFKKDRCAAALILSIRRCSRHGLHGYLPCACRDVLPVGVHPLMIIDDNGRAAAAGNVISRFL
jgi:hypothetical protein